MVDFLFREDDAKGETMLCYLFGYSVVDLIFATSEHRLNVCVVLILFVFFVGTSRVPVLLVATTEDRTKAIFRYN